MINSKRTMNDFGYLRKASAADYERYIALMPSFADKELGVKRIDGGVVLPGKDLGWSKIYGGVVDASGNHVNSSSWIEDIGGAYDYNKKDVANVGGTVIFVGYLYGHWGHLFTDDLKKMWFLETSECKRLVGEGAKLIYITKNNKPYPERSKQMLKKAGIDLDQMTWVDRLSRFDTVIVPDNSLICEKPKRTYTKDYERTVSTVKSRICSLLAPTLSEFDGGGDFEGLFHKNKATAKRTRTRRRENRAGFRQSRI